MLRTGAAAAADRPCRFQRLTRRDPGDPPGPGHDGRVPALSAHRAVRNRTEIVSYGVIYDAFPVLQPYRGRNGVVEDRGHGGVLGREPGRGSRGNPGGTAAAQVRTAPGDDGSERARRSLRRRYGRRAVLRLVRSGVAVKKRPRAGVQAVRRDG